MNEEIKAKWIAALRSGKYVQGVERLHRKSLNNDEFCCLGVLCEIAADNDVVDRVGTDYSIGYWNRMTEGYASWASLPTSVMLWAGLRQDDPVINPFESATTLSNLNDSQRLSFDEIATVIEEAL